MKTDEEKFQECMAAFAPLGQLAKFAKGWQKSEFFGGPLDGLKRLMPPEPKNIGISSCDGRSARYYLSANGDFFFIGWSKI